MAGAPKPPRHDGTATSGQPVTAVTFGSVLHASTTSLASGASSRSGGTADSGSSPVAALQRSPVGVWSGGTGYASDMTRTPQSVQSSKSGRKKRRKKKRREASSRTPLLAEEGGAAGGAGEFEPVKRKPSSMNVSSDEGARCECECQCGRACRCNPCSRRSLCALLAILLVLLGGGGAAYYFLLRPHHHVPSSPWSPFGPATPALCVAPADRPFYFWNGLVNDEKWWTPLSVKHNQSFLTKLTPAAGAQTNSKSDLVRLQVDWANHFAIQLHGNPEYLKSFDDAIREWNPNAHMYSGTIDSCGWPDEPDGKPGMTKGTKCFWEDFRYGWSDARIKIALVKTCCSEDAFRYVWLLLLVVCGTPQCESSVPTCLVASQAAQLDMVPRGSGWCRPSIALFRLRGHGRGRGRVPTRDRP